MQNDLGFSLFAVLSLVIIDINRSIIDASSKMTKSILTLEFKQCKSDTGMYYYHDEKIGELIIAIIYVDNIYFIGLKKSLLFLELK